MRNRKIRLSIFILSIIIVTSIYLVDSNVKADEPNNVDCIRCHPKAMERHRFPTSLCNSCHNNDMSTLLLKNGKNIPIEQSTELCAQCHNDIYQSWKDGKHGEVKSNCVECHNPHSANKQISPLGQTSILSLILQIFMSGGAVVTVALVALMVRIKIQE